MHFLAKRSAQADDRTPYRHGGGSGAMQPSGWPDQTGHDDVATSHYNGDAAAVGRTLPNRAKLLTLIG
jgi:hypothetical protein